MIEEQDLVPLHAAGRYPALVLNANYRPLGLFPLEVYAWQDAIKAIWLDRVDVVALHDRVIHSPSRSIQLPSIIAVRRYVHRNRTPAFTRANVLLRDRFSCGYCGHVFNASKLTKDHVIPRSRGGATSWENIITACTDCNKTKDARTPHEAGMELKWRPWKPTPEELFRAGKHYPPGSVPAAWLAYLGQDEIA